ncbi:Uncharacterized protein dnl_06340 [Desulfonema limicola]|uniref:Restriction endonuclease n=1 Tax=Desulfonema limicola TaxID=45656 RepID=A0A975B436_9BACT|nr:hypothetical protein [Desulfonema limicola]QTA78413.1 Uncharacterized protein dnl_06340 [Desulfonema limicola]
MGKYKIITEKSEDKQIFSISETVIPKLNNEFQTFRSGFEFFPMLFKYGLSDGAVHAAGVSYLLNLGIIFGLPAIAEYPITLHSPESWKKAGRIFPDCIWFHPENKTPWISLEFERFEKGDENKINSKAQNLALSHHQSNGSIELCVFIYWLRSGSAPVSLSPLSQTFSNGFFRKGIQVPPPSCKFLIYKIVMGQPEICSEKIMERIAPYPNTNQTVNHLIIKEIRKVSGNI